jgi:murein DD-endopeptidase MepM/ murein hydrolase activator NlpD
VEGHDIKPHTVTGRDNPVEFDPVPNNRSVKPKGRLGRVMLSAAAIQVAAACLVGTLLMGGSLYYYNLRKTGYGVEFKGKFLGYVRDSQEAVKALDGAREEIRRYDPEIVIDDRVKMEKSLVNSEKVVTGEEIEKAIKADLLEEYSAFAISINGEELVMVKNEDDARQVIQNIRDYHRKQQESDNIKVVDVVIKDDVQLVRKIASASRLVNVDEAVSRFLGGKGTTSKYVIKPGDSIWRIARNCGMKVSEIMALNPDVKVDMLHAGQTINLSVSRPYINVETTVEASIDEKVPFGVRYVSDSELYKGQTEVKTQGEYGINMVVKKIVMLNGREVANSVLSTTMVKSPVTQVMSRGTRQLMGSGKFLWPARGVVTSNFGSRGGTLHKGLDIGAPYGTNICAADGGTVIYTGYSSSYGYLVKIDHGNGYVTYYAHCSSLLVENGQTVAKGQHIAEVGHTGNATGNHLHFEVRLNDIPQNPLNYLK